MASKENAYKSQSTNSWKNYATVKMKPIPATREECLQEIKNSLRGVSAGPNAYISTPRNKLIFCMDSSRKICRSLNYASILLFGNSGVGKSSTINHLLKSHIAKTSISESQTRITSEFVLTADEPKFEVSDLKLGIVDTPGFHCTDGSKQDVCNFYSIKKFYETHPQLSNCYPNLIFVVVAATDMRTVGPNSDFLKSVRCLKQLGLVDQYHPNVVAIITHCCSIPCKNVPKWVTRMEAIKAIVRRIVFDNLKVAPMVVLLENDYGDEGQQLEVDGDFTRLPNDVLQPKNLYNACQKVLEENSDRFGLITLNACFVNLKKGRPTLGHKVEAKDASKEKLGAEEEKYLNTLEKLARGGTDDHIIDTAEQYIQEKNLNPEQQQEILEIAATLKKMGVENEEDCKFISEESVKYFNESEISETGEKILQEKFGIKKKAFDSDHIVGHGYNIIIDKSTPAEIMMFGNEEKDFGLVLPKCAKVRKVNKTLSIANKFEDTKSYIESRLTDLHVNLEVQPDIFKMGPRAGWNKGWEKSASGDSSTTEVSFLYEHRMFQVEIANYKENLKKGVTFTSDFTSAVNNLPSEYVKSDPENRNHFQRFFDRFGHFIVSSACAGGAVEVRITEQTLKSEGLSLEEAKMHIAASFESAFFSASGEVSSSSTSSSKAGTRSSLMQSNQRWLGGSPDLHNNDTLTSPDKMRKWQISLLEKPALLSTEMTLEPISTVIGCIDAKKDEASYSALKDLLGGKFKVLASREKEIEKEQEIKMEKARIQANTRVDTVKDPDTNGFWQWLKNIIVSPFRYVYNKIWN